LEATVVRNGGLRIDCEVCVCKLQRTRIHVTRALAVPMEHHKKTHK
jgi:hypothetical protein